VGAGLKVGIRVALSVGVSTGVAVGDKVGVANGIVGQGVGVGVGLSSSLGNAVGSTVGTRGWKATTVTNMASVGSGVGSCSRVQPIAVNNRIEAKAKHPALYRLINTTGGGVLWAYWLQFTIGVAAITLFVVEEFSPLPILLMSDTPALCSRVALG